MKQSFRIKVNDQVHLVHTDPETPLLYVLRNDLAYKAPKYGCGLGQCGACMILFNDTATPSCQLQVQAVGNASVTTLEKLSESADILHKVQQSFIEEQAAQCGYCTNGMIITAVALLIKDPNPSENSIRTAMNMVLCRCGVYMRVLKAIQKAAQMK